MPNKDNQSRSALAKWSPRVRPDCCQPKGFTIQKSNVCLEKDYKKVHALLLILRWPLEAVFTTISTARARHRYDAWNARIDRKAPFSAKRSTILNLLSAKILCPDKTKASKRPLSTVALGPGNPGEMNTKQPVNSSIAPRYFFIVVRDWYWE